MFTIVSIYRHYKHKCTTINGPNGRLCTVKTDEGWLVLLGDGHVIVVQTSPTVIVVVISRIINTITSTVIIIIAAIFLKAMELEGLQEQRLHGRRHQLVSAVKNDKKKHMDIVKTFGGQIVPFLDALFFPTTQSPRLTAKTAGGNRRMEQEKHS